MERLFLVGNICATPFPQTFAVFDKSARCDSLEHIGWGGSHKAVRLPQRQRDLWQEQAAVIPDPWRRQEGKTALHPGWCSSVESTLYMLFLQKSHLTGFLRPQSSLSSFQIGKGRGLTLRSSPRLLHHLLERGLLEPWFWLCLEELFPPWW